MVIGNCADLHHSNSGPTKSYFTSQGCKIWIPTTLQLWLWGKSEKPALPMIENDCSLHPQKLRRCFQRVTPFKPGWGGSTWNLILSNIIALPPVPKSNIYGISCHRPSPSLTWQWNSKNQNIYMYLYVICALPEFRDWFSRFMSDCSLGKSRFNQQMFAITKVSYGVIQPNHALVSVSTNTGPHTPQTALASQLA